MSLLKQLFSRRRLYGDLSEVIQEHLDEKIEELVASGMSRKEATYSARREFGNVMLMEEDSRAVWRWAAMEDLFMDVRFGVRMLRKNPGFTAVAIVTLALGIAVNTTIFSTVNGWMLRPPNIKDPGRVVVILSTDPAKGGYGWDQNPVSVPDFIAWRAQSQSFEDMVASHGSDFALTGGTEPEWCDGARVSANYFPSARGAGGLRTNVPSRRGPARSRPSGHPEPRIMAATVQLQPKGDWGSCATRRRQLRDSRGHAEGLSVRVLRPAIVDAAGLLS